jgi:glycosyltransferase involved in cell wall biosynthesis
MDDSALITCVIPTYRRPQMLARAIRSALNQTFPRLRVLVTDNASGDETEQVVRSIQARDSRVTYHCHSEDIGMVANFAYGMSQVETPFYSLLSDDDILLPEFYETAIGEFQKYPQTILVATLVPSLTEDGSIITIPLASWDRMGLFDPPAGAHRVAAIGHPELPGILFRREFLETPYSKLDPGIHAGDYEMILNAALEYPIVTVDALGACFIQHRAPRELPANLFSLVDECWDRIRRVDLDDRFPPHIKVGNRRKWLNWLSIYLRDAIIRLALRADHIATEKALAVLSRDVGNGDLAAKLRLLDHFCRLLPFLRPHLLSLFEVLVRLRSKWYESRRSRLEPRYLELLRIG